jgi:hypothetical protein
MFRLLWLLASLPLLAYSFQQSFPGNSHHCQRLSSVLSAAAKKQSNVIEAEEAPAGIGGATFFGGSKQKDELFEEEAEEQATVEISTSYNRFFDGENPREAFDSFLTAEVASSLQSQINAVLYENAAEPNSDFSYDDNLSWETPLSKTGGSPLRELQNSLDFYKNIDAAIISGKKISDSTMEFQWEVSVVWPTFWSPRVHLVGTSVCTMDASTKKIIHQIDTLLDNIDVLSTISSQVKPRFWDWYHIGMTPCTEQMPQLCLKEPPFGGYRVYEIPPRLVASPTMVEVGSRDDRNAQTIPNHAFSCIIKTAGPTRQRYVPTTPVEVQIIPGQEKKIKWAIPLAVEFLTNTELPLPGIDEEAMDGSNPNCSYDFQPRRKVATVKYGGNAQDPEISDIRKKLYDKIMKGGLKPKLDKNGRPIFFFFQNTAKACYTEEGLGMCVYEWRPKAAKPNEVGIELDFS